MSRPDHRLSVTQRRHQWLYWRLPQDIGHDGMFSVKITFLSWLMAPSLLPPVRCPGDRMWRTALSSRRSIYFLHVCSDLFTREVTMWFSDPGSAVGRRRLAWPGGDARIVCDMLPSDPITLEGLTWSPPAVHSEERSRATWPRPLGHRRPIGSRVIGLNVRLTGLFTHPVHTDFVPPLKNPCRRYWFVWIVNIWQLKALPWNLRHRFWSSFPKKNYHFEKKPCKNALKAMSGRQKVVVYYLYRPFILNYFRPA